MILGILAAQGALYLQAVKVEGPKKYLALHLKVLVDVVS